MNDLKRKKFEAKKGENFSSIPILDSNSFFKILVLLKNDFKQLIISWNKIGQKLMVWLFMVADAWLFILFHFFLSKNCNKNWHKFFVVLIYNQIFDKFTMKYFS